MVFVINYVWGQANDICCAVQAIYDDEVKAYYAAEKYYVKEILDSERDPDSDSDSDDGTCGEVSDYIPKYLRKWFPCKNVSHCYHWKYCDICESIHKFCKCNERWTTIPVPSSYIDRDEQATPERLTECFSKTSKSVRLEWRFGHCIPIDTHDNRFYTTDNDMINDIFVDECSICWD